MVAGGAVILAIFMLGKTFSGNEANIAVNLSNEPTISSSVSVLPSISPSMNVSVSPTPFKTPTPTLTPSPTKKPSLIPSSVPWDQLPPEASCELRGEIKYVLINNGTNHNNVYDNQNAMFTYKGIDHPGRLVYWTVSPQDDLGVGPQIFAQIPIPDGESLIGISLPENPQYKQYELNASITYGRLVDGNVKVFTKQCVGKTTVVLP